MGGSQRALPSLKTAGTRALVFVIAFGPEQAPGCLIIAWMEGGCKRETQFVRRDGRRFLPPPLYGAIFLPRPALAARGLTGNAAGQAKPRPRFRKRGGLRKNAISAVVSRVLSLERSSI